MPTTKQISTVASVQDELTDVLFNLKDRWASEKGFEDFDDYRAAIENAIVKRSATTLKGVCFISMTREFRLTWKDEEGNVYLTRPVRRRLRTVSK